MSPVTPYVAARLVATLPVRAPVGHWVHVTDTGLFVVNTQEAVAAHDFEALLAGRSEPVTFTLPARRRTAAAVSPGRGFAVFPTTHALRAVGADGGIRWEHRHPCWAYKCEVVHADASEYADDEWHRYPDSGSAAFSADGRHVWAHVPAGGDEQEWLVLDASDGEVLARAGTGTPGHGSEHHSRSGPGRMGLSLALQSFSPLLWGRFDGSALHVEHAGGERGMLSAGPRAYLTLADDRRRLAAHRLGDDTVLGEVEPPGFEGVAAEDAHGDDEAFWHFDAVIVDDDTAVAPTNESDVARGINRHWLVDIPSMRLTPLRYPEEHGRLVAIGGGRWITIGEKDGVPRVWERMS